MSQANSNPKPENSGQLEPAELRISMNRNLHGSIEHAALKRGLTAGNFAKMCIVERLESTKELSECDGIACNGLCDGHGNVKTP